MSITDELRKYALGWDERNRVRRDLRAIADRIDIEHEAQLNDAFETRNSDENQENDGWIRLPKDANGEYIHIGDMIEHIELGYVLEVIAVGVNCFIAWNAHLSRYCQYDSKLFRHHHEPTIEDVLAEFALEIDPSADIAVTGAETIKKFAAKLQLKEPSEACTEYEQKKH